MVGYEMYVKMVTSVCCLVRNLGRVVVFGVRFGWWIDK